MGVRRNRNHRDEASRSDSVLTLSKKDARRMEREARDEAARQTTKRQPLKTMVSNLLQERRDSQSRPSAVGWNRRGGGPAGYIEGLYELQGTTVQVCGYYPFIEGVSTPAVGAPLGYHLTKNTVVHGDPVSWYVHQLIRNPSAFVMGQPGLGKTALIQRIVTVLAAWGVIPMVLTDTRPDYVTNIRLLDGQVIRFSPGQGHMNLFDMGPMVHQLWAIEDDERRHEAIEDMRNRRRSLVAGIVAMVSGRQLEPHETNVLSRSIEALDPDLTDPPLLPDVIDYIRSAPRELRHVTLTHAEGQETEYDNRVRGLLDALIALGPEGLYGDMFSKPTTTHIEQGRPVVFDISGVSENDTVLMGTVQSLCWNLGSATVAAEQFIAEAEGRAQRHYVLIMDELWRMLRASSQMVYFIDTIIRLNRGRGLGQILCTHTMNDLELSTEVLTKIAWGFVERSEMVFLGGLAPNEMGNLETVFDLSRAERASLTDWTDDSGSGNDGVRKRPNTGKFILKTGKRPGTPFRTALTAAEAGVSMSDAAWETPTKPKMETADAAK